MKLPVTLSPGKIMARTSRGLLLERHKHLSRHVVIYGGTGGGKTMLMQLLSRQLVSQGEGLTKIDPHGDDTERTLQWLALEGVDPERIWHLKPGKDCSFSFDPFANAPTGVPFVTYEAWLTSAVDRLFRACVRNVAAADQEMMKRLKRWFRNIGYVCGFDIGGEHPGFSKALALTDPSHPDFEGMIAAFRPRVRSEVGRVVLADFDKLANTKNARQQEQWVESTINLLRDLLSPSVMQIFDQRAPSVNFREAILGRKIVLADLRKSDFLSRDQANIIGGIIINFLLHAAENIAEERQEEDRVDHLLMIDEAENFIGEDLRMGFAELRKFRMALCLAVQDLGCLRKGDLDATSKVLSQPALQITFQQGNPDDVELLAKKFGYGSLDMTALLAEQVLPDGYMVIPTQSISVGVNRGVSASEAESVTRTQSRTTQHHTAENIQRSVSLALSETDSEGESESVTDSESTGRSSSINWSEGWNDTHGMSSSRSRSRSHGHSETRNEGHSEGTTDTTHDSRSTNRGESGRLAEHDPTHSRGHAESRGSGHGRSSNRSSNHGTSESASESEGETASESHSTGKSGARGGADSLSQQTGHANTRGRNKSRSNGQTHTKGMGVGTTRGSSAGQSDGRSVGKTTGHTASEGITITRSLSETPLAMQRIVNRPTGSLVVSVQDQLYAIMNRLASLPDRMVLVTCRGMKHPFILKVHEVIDPYKRRKLLGSRAWRADDMRLLLEKVHRVHPFYFTPGDEEQEDESDGTVLLPMPRGPKPRRPAEMVATRTEASPML